MTCSIDGAQKEAYNFIDKALNADNAGHRAKAVGFYKKGIAIYTNILTSYSALSNTLTVQETQSLGKCKMYLTMTQERLDVLETKHTTTAKMPTSIRVPPKDSSSLPFTNFSKLNISGPTRSIGVTGPSAKPRSKTPAETYRPRPYKAGTSTPVGRSPGAPRRQRTRTDSTGKPKLDYTGLDKKLAEQIMDEIVLLKRGNNNSFEAIAGNEQAKTALNETVILPALRPEIFTGLRAPPKGILLFGPPGCGKTMLARALAAETKCTFFNISASALTSKWQGEGEKLVKTLFNLARQLSPTIIFIDEIDSFLTERKENENDGTRRLKTEFMLQFDGMVSEQDEKLLVLGATNRPMDLDDAVLRRFPKRIYVRLPDEKARLYLLTHVLKGQHVRMTAGEMKEILRLTEGYSGSDLNQLAKEAAYEPIRTIDPAKLKTVDLEDVPPITGTHFKAAARRIRPSVNPSSLQTFANWTKSYGDVS